jgi:excisionase family DNA binding protein
MLSKVLNTKEAAGYLGTGIRTIYRLAASGQIPAAKVGGRWRFHVDALDRWLISLSEGNLVQNNPNKREGKMP